jgi:probable addiction module antidote protein
MTTKPWDVADHLKSEEDIAAYLAAVSEEGDPILAAAALEDVLRARQAHEAAKPPS